MRAYLLSGHRFGQRATAVAESPTSKMEEQGLIPAGGAVSLYSSDPHGPHTITWTDRQRDRTTSGLAITRVFSAGLVFFLPVEKKQPRSSCGAEPSSD